MATMEAAAGPWGDGDGGGGGGGGGAGGGAEAAGGGGGGGGEGSLRRRQRPPKIGDIPRHSAVDLESPSAALQSPPPPPPPPRLRPAPAPAPAPLPALRSPTALAAPAAPAPPPPPRIVRAHHKVRGSATASAPASPRAAPRAPAAAITSERFRRSAPSPPPPPSPSPFPRTASAPAPTPTPSPREHSLPATPTAKDAPPPSPSPSLRQAASATGSAQPPQAPTGQAALATASAQSDTQGHRDIALGTASAQSDTPGHRDVSASVQTDTPKHRDVEPATGSAQRGTPKHRDVEVSAQSDTQVHRDEAASSLPETSVPRREAPGKVPAQSDTPVHRDVALATASAQRDTPGHRDVGASAQKDTPVPRLEATGTVPAQRDTPVDRDGGASAKSDTPVHRDVEALTQPDTPTPRHAAPATTPTQSAAHMPCEASPATPPTQPAEPTPREASPAPATPQPAAQQAGSPASGRRSVGGQPGGRGRPPPLRESRRVSVSVSVDRSGSSTCVHLNQYRLEKDLGQGSFGVVKVAYNQEDDTRYAMKILSKRRLLKKAGVFGRQAPARGGGGGVASGSQPSPLERVYREIALLKKLRHPNIVRLVEVLDDPGEDHLYLVFELLERGEVLRVPTERPLPEASAWAAFRDALLGVEYLHFQRIVHRDLKPSNLLLAAGGRVQIGDLGVCSEFEGADAALASTVGTPAFLAPEALAPPDPSAGRPSFSGRALDVWALGATLYAFVFGQVPFCADSVPALYRRILSDPVRFPEQPQVSAPLLDLLSRMLDKDPRRRITLPHIKEHPWVTASGTAPLPSEEENCAERVEVTEAEVEAVAQSIPRLGTLCLVKAMLKKHSFQNPYGGSVGGGGGGGGRRGGGGGGGGASPGLGAGPGVGPGAAGVLAASDAFRSGRSHSAPGACSDRKSSIDALLPALREITSPESSKASNAASQR